jgi:hypothetical protein
VRRGRKAADLIIKMAELPENTHSVSSAFLWEKGKEEMRDRPLFAMSVLRSRLLMRLLLHEAQKSHRY